MHRARRRADFARHGRDDAVEADSCLTREDAQ